MQELLDKPILLLHTNITLETSISVMFLVEHNLSLLVVVDGVSTKVSGLLEFRVL